MPPRLRRVTLLDVGLDDAFDASMTFVQGTIQSINAGETNPFVVVDFFRSHDQSTILSAFVAECDILHVMGHGDHEGRDPYFASSDGKTWVSLSDVSDWVAEAEQGISTWVILADGCRTATQVWQKAIGDCLQGPVTYIGTTAAIGWHDSTVFCSAFYSSMFRNRGIGETPAERAFDAAERAIKTFTDLTGHRCPFTVITLEPTLRARKLFG